MATALVEPFAPSVKASLEMQSLDMDKERSLPVSPDRRSCFNLSNVEPCVNKAIAHLDTLKKRLAKSAQLPPGASPVLQTSSQPKERVVDPQYSRTTTPKSILVKRGEGNTSSGRESRLIIEGVSTGIPIEKDVHPKKQTVGLQCDWLEADDIINGAVRLVAHLEQDRQETLDRLENEKVRVQRLGESLDKECEKRHTLLPSAIQKEHEECLRDLLELKWHVAYEGRMLARIEDDFRVTSEKNEHLKKEVSSMTKSCPLLEEKLVLENDHMSDIARQQQETSDQLNRAKHSLMQTEDKSQKAHHRADVERQQIEDTLEEIRVKLVTASNQLKDAQTEAVTMSHKMKECHKKIAENKSLLDDLESQHDQSKVHQRDVQECVDTLHSDHSRMEANHRRLEEKIRNLEAKKQAEHDNLEAEYVVLLAAMQQENSNLRAVRDRNDDMEQENDSLQERITSCVKQTHDDEKSVERARKELVKLDQQMRVSVTRFTKVREDHSGTSEELKSEETKAGSVEHTLKSNIEILKHQLKDQGRTKLTYEGKIQATAADLDKVRAECKRTAEKAQKVAIEAEKRSKEQTDIVTKLAESRDGKNEMLASLQSQLTSVEGEHISSERNLRERFTVLTPKEQQLRIEVQEKVSSVDAVSERIKLLERKLEDVVRSTAMLVKMEGVTTTTIEQLGLQLSEVKDNLAVEKKEEESWRVELREISDFSSDAKDKHQKYLEERSELLEKHKLGLHKALSMNASLAAHYRHLQHEFVEAKKLALMVMEKKLDMEASLRDHKQLLAFQSCIYSTMKAYYEHRGVGCRRDLAQFCDQSKQNMQQLGSLREQFKTVIEIMNEFLKQEQL